MPLKANIEQPEGPSLDRVKAVAVPRSDENTVSRCQPDAVPIDLMQTLALIQAQDLREAVIVQTIRLFPLELHPRRRIESIHLISLHSVNNQEIS